MLSVASRGTRGSRKECWRKCVKRTVSDLVRTPWKEVKVVRFIEFVCEKIGVAIPDEAKLPILRVQVDKELESYERGETEVQDCYFICVTIADGDHSVFRRIEYLVEKSNPLTTNPSASDFTPKCVDNQPLHDLACVEATVIQSEASDVSVGI